MSHEATDELISLRSVLQSMEMCRDDWDDNHYREEEWNQLAEMKLKVRNLYHEIKEADPELDLRMEPFLAGLNQIGKTKDEQEREVFEVLIDGSLSEIIKSINEILPEDKEGRQLLDQLNIPLMSLVNHQIHPTREGYMVYHFKDEEQATTFEKMLGEKELFFERFDEVRAGTKVFWFGVREQDFDTIEIINYTVKGLYRKPLIRDKVMRYFVVALGVLIILMAIIGGIVGNL